MATIDKEILKHDPVAETIVKTLQRLKPHWRRIVAVTAIALIVASFVWSRVQRRERIPQEAGFRLATAQSVEDLERIVQDFPQTFAAPAALAQLGYRMATQTNYAAALSYYEKLVQIYPRSFLVPAAQLAAVKCRIALADAEPDPAVRQRRLEEVETYLKRELLYNRDHYAAPLAQLELIRLLTSMGRYEEALSELNNWHQQPHAQFLASLTDGLYERLLRITGAATNLPPEASYEEPRP